MSEINFIVDSSGTGNGNTHSRDRGNPIVPLGLWDRKDSGTLVALVGHGSPEDFPWSPWDFGMGRTVGLWWPWWDMGIPRTFHGPLETLGWEGQWD